MSNTAQHTPTPWVVYDGDWITTPDTETPIAAAHENAEANAAFIVRACNSHDSMRLALAMVADTIAFQFLEPQIQRMVMESLAAAGAP